MFAVDRAISILAILMIFTAGYINEEKNLERATYVYCLQTLTLAMIFFALSTIEWYFVIWGCAAILTKAVIIPYFILKTIRHTGVSIEEEPYLPTWVSYLLLGFLTAIGFTIGYNIITTWEHIPLSVSISLFLIGLHLMITRKNALKQILGICHFENGSHLTLAVMARGIPETVEIGILTDAVILVIICCLLVKDMKKVVGTLDTSKLSLLKY
ncbi:MAG: hydrogenase 4 membrane subunit [Candidatus Odinarchaeota archaeon]|nr:hydrogenase 4 membrane subunit [Candidatus Odinarchaeota archaeon]